MHALSLTTLFLLAWLTVSPAKAEKVSVSPQHLSIEVRGKYGVRSDILYKDGDKWACHTNDMPYVEVHGDPVSSLNWGKLAQEAQGGNTGCRDQVFIVDTRRAPARSIHSCLTLPQVKKWVANVDHACGRD